MDNSQQFILPAVQKFAATECEASVLVRALTKLRQNIAFLHVLRIFRIFIFISTSTQHNSVR